MTNIIFNMTKEELIENIAKCDKQGETFTKSLNGIISSYNNIIEQEVEFEGVDEYLTETIEYINYGKELLLLLAQARNSMKTLLRDKYETHLM